MTIVVRIELRQVRGIAGLSPDKELKQRAALAQRIRQYADRGGLGPRFTRVELLTPSDEPAPEAAVFTFDPWPGAEPEADELDRQRLVADFVERLALKP